MYSYTFLESEDHQGALNRTQERRDEGLHGMISSSTLESIHHSKMLEHFDFHNFKCRGKVINCHLISSVISNSVSWLKLCLGD